jgi:hypothetical protein
MKADRGVLKYLSGLSPPQGHNCPGAKNKLMTFFLRCPWTFALVHWASRQKKNKANSGRQLEKNIREIRPPGPKKSQNRTLLLLSGGLDSLLAESCWRSRGWKFRAEQFESVFFEPARAIVAAEKLNWPLI